MIGNAIKEAAARINQKVEEAWDTSVTKHKMMTVLGKMGHIELALDSKIKEHSLNLKREQARLHSREEKLKKLIAEKEKAVEKFDELSAQFNDLQGKTEEEFRQGIKEHYEQAQQFFGVGVFSSEILAAAQKSQSKEDALKLIAKPALEAQKTALKMIEKSKAKVVKIEQSKVKTAELMDTYKEYLDKHYRRRLEQAQQELDQINDIIGTLEDEELLDDKQKGKVEKAIKKVFKEIQLLNQITGNKKQLLIEAESSPLISDTLLSTLQDTQRVLQADKVLLIQAINNLFIELTKLGF
jgi:DNA repair exonuclease SbcCD ATPase subunit